MKSIFKYITSFLVGAMTLAACQQEVTPLGTEISVNPTTITVEAGKDAADATVTVTSDGDWIAVTPEWITVSPAYGVAGETTVTLSFADNLDEDGSLAAARKVTVLFSVNSVSAELAVEQAGDPNKAPAEVQIVTCSEFNAAEDGTGPYRVTGTIKSITEISPSDKYNNGTLTISDETGDLYLYRVGPGEGKKLEDLALAVGDKITVEGKKGSYKGSPQMAQGGEILEVEKSLIAVSKVLPESLPIEGGELMVTLMCKGEGIEVAIPEDVSWLTEVSAEHSGELAVVVLNAEENEGGNRSTDIEFITTFNGEEYKSVVTVNQLGAIAEVSVEDFLAAEEGKALYKLTGKVANLKAGDYGNFDLVDATGSVYVYGLTATQVESNDKSFPSLGIKEGDIVTLIGTRASYNGTAQVGGPAYYVSHVGHTEATVAEFIAAAEDDTRYKLTGTISNIALKDGEVSPYGNFDLTDETGTVYVYGLTVAPVDKNDQSFLELGLKEGDKVTIIGTRTSYKGTVQVGGPAYYISHEAAGSDTPDTPAEPETPAGFEAGSYWIMGTKDDVTKVMTPLAADKTYGYAASAEVTDGASTEANVFTFTAVEGGFTIQDASGRYYYQEEGTPHKTFSVSDELPANGGVWTVAADSGNTYTITSAASGKVVGYAEGTYTSFGVYGEGEGEGSVHPTLVKVAK